MWNESDAFQNYSLISTNYATISFTTHFWLYLFIIIPSLVCSFFVLYHLIFNSTLRRTLTNHTIILILFIGLICELTNYPWMVYYYQHEGQWNRSLLFCEIWGFLDWGLYITQTMLFAWTTIERHILIFNDNWVSTRKKRCFVHYLPSLAILTYCILFYSIAYFFPPCEQSIDLNSSVCVHVCFLDKLAIWTWETIAHQMIPTLIILLFSSTLLIRVLWQKYRIRQPIQWRKHRKMTIQLLSITFLYVTFFLPYAIVTFIQLYTNPSNKFNDSMEYAILLSYLLLPAFPFVCILSLPELRRKLIQIVPILRYKRRIVPITVPLRTVMINKKQCTQK